MTKHAIGKQETLLLIASFIIVVLLITTVISSLSFIGTKVVKALSIPEAGMNPVTQFDIQGFEKLGL